LSSANCKLSHIDCAGDNLESAYLAARPVLPWVTEEL
jgi:hypothetical protein